MDVSNFTKTKRENFISVILFISIEMFPSMTGIIKQRSNEYIILLHITITTPQNDAIEENVLQAALFIAM